MKREMWLVWRQPGGRRYVIGRLLFEENKYSFEYMKDDLENAQNDGLLYYPGFDSLTKKYESESLFPNIQTRLPNSKRPDYLDVLNRYGLDDESNEMEILMATKGRLVTDTFEFVPAFDNRKVEFNVAGTNYNNYGEHKDIILPNDKLNLELEPDNQQDTNAVRVILDKNEKRIILGYVPLYYSKQLAELLRKGTKYSAMVKSVNPNSSIADEHVSVEVKLVFQTS